MKCPNCSDMMLIHQYNGVVNWVCDNCGTVRYLHSLSDVAIVEHICALERGMQKVRSLADEIRESHRSK